MTFDSSRIDELGEYTVNILEFDYRKYDKTKKIVIYGTKEYAAITSYCLQQMSVPLYSYADEKGCVLPDVSIMGVTSLSEMYQNNEVIILIAESAQEYEREINVLEYYSIDTVYTIWKLLDEVDFKGANFNEYIHNVYLDERQMTRLLQEKTSNPEGLYIRSLDAMVSERCSLKCEGCSNLMQYYVHPENLSIKDLRESIDQLLSQVDRIWQLRILGGEPFMNCKFTELVDAYIDEPKILEISVFTNATIFPNDDVLEHLKHKKVVMRMSDYGSLSRKLDRWTQWCEDNDVHYRISVMDEWQDCGKLEKHDYSEFELRTIYGKCECRNLPTIVKNRLYNCPYASNAANLEAMDREDMLKDSIALDGTMPSKKEIDEFLYERPYLEACRYCLGRSYDHPAIEPYVQTDKPLQYEKRLDKSVRIKEDVQANPQEKKISIIVPVYNVEQYVGRCVESILAQTYTNFELFLIDDGSTDTSIEICEKTSNGDPRVKIIKQAHSGVTTARNQGIEKANGEYLTFVDADDWVEKEYLENMISRIGKSDILISGYVKEIQWAKSNKPEFIKNESEVKKEQVVEIPNGIYEGKKMELIWDNMFIQTQHMIPVHLWGKLYRTDYMKQVYRLLDPTIWYSEDRALTHICLMYCSSVTITEPLGIHYCDRRNIESDERYDFDYILDNYEKYYRCLKRAIQQHPLKKRFMRELDLEFTEFIMIHLKYNKNLDNRDRGTLEYYPYYGRLEGKKIIVYGAGNVGKSYRRHIIEERESELVLWVDKNAVEYRKKFLDVADVSDILDQEYDYIIIAVAIERIANQIKDELVKMGVPHDKILWNKTKWG